MIARLLVVLQLAVAASAFMAAQPVTPGDLLVASRDRPPFDGVDIASELTVYDPQGELKRNFMPEWGFCRGLFAETKRGGRIACGDSSRVVILDLEGNLVSEPVAGYDHLSSVLIIPDTTILAAEQTAPVAARIVAVRPDGTVTEYSLPPASDVFVLGVSSMDLLPDRCTLLYTIGSHYAVDFRRVARFDICTGQVLPDLFRLPETAILAGGIRVLPGGEILVATGYDVRRYDQSGRETGIYYAFAQQLALTTDGKGFWAASGSTIHRFSLDSRFPLGPPLRIRYSVGSMAVVDEWRATMSPDGPRRRAVRR